MAPREGHHAWEPLGSAAAALKIQCKCQYGDFLSKRVRLGARQKA